MNMSCRLKQENYHLSILFKHILITYLDENDIRSILTVSIIEEFDIAIFLGINLRYDNNCALMHASRNGYEDVVRYLAEKGSDIHARDDQALRWASKYGHLSIVEYLVENGADIHAKEDDALRSASEN